MPFRSAAIYLMAGAALASGSAAGTSIAVADDTKTPTTARKPVLDNDPRPLDLAAHPLTPIIHRADVGSSYIAKEIRDYTCLCVKRERVKGELLPYEYMLAKVRHEQTRDGRVIVPFSIYLKFLAPNSVKGREVLYVHGQHDNKLFARRGGPRFGYVTASVDPTSDVAMSGNRYPIFQFGIQNLVVRLAERAREDRKVGVCEVKIADNAKVDGRTCTAIQVTHDKPDPRYRYHRVRVFIDESLRIPVHYESYDWPAESGTKPRLLEQYTYRDVKLNTGLTDRDFTPSTYGLDSK